MLEKMLNNINLFEHRWKKCVHFIDCSMDGWIKKVLLNKKKCVTADCVEMKLLKNINKGLNLTCRIPILFCYIYHIFLYKVF